MIPLDGVAVPTVERDLLDFQAYDHQATAEDLIKSHDPFFAVNESPTGSGKTLSWLKPVLDEEVDTIAVFPTNALVADQVEAAENFVRDYYDTDSIGIVEATGKTISQWRSDYSVRTKGKALARRVDESLARNDTTILFSNPDTLVIVRKGMYHHEFVSNKFDRFQMVVLDEFHLADVKQRDTLLFLIDEMYELPANQSQTNRFYFLSATPEGDDSPGRSLLDRLREDLRVEVERISARGQPLSKVRDTDRWVSVMPEVDLSLRESQTFRTAEALLSDNKIDDFLQFCEATQTVVMLDGVHEVDRVYETFSDQLNCDVRRISGFHKGDISSKIQDFDVLVSNSAVEVGLDFQPDRLVFSAHNAATLIQRLGRLRYKDQPGPLEARCYVPGPIRASLESTLPTGSEVNRISRVAFEDSVRASFTDECDLSSFSKRWGELEAFQHVKERAEDVPSGLAREEVMDRGLDRIKRHFYAPYGRSFDKDDLKRLHDWSDYDVIEELKTYRGSGLQVMVKDQEDDTTPMKLYDMFHLLRWGQVEFMSPNRFQSVLSDDERDYFDGYSDYAVGFCVYEEKIPTDSPDADTFPGRSVALHAEGAALHRMKNTSDRQREPEAVDGLGVHVDSGEAPPVEGLDYLREEMTRAKRVCYVVPGHPSSVKATYGLDDFFFLYPLGEDSVAIGLNAFYLHCLVQDRIESERTWSRYE